MPLPLPGKYRLSLGAPYPANMLSVMVLVGPGGATIPFVSPVPIPYNPPPIDLFGSPGGRTKLECSGDGVWHGSITRDDGTVVLLEGTCVGPLP